MALPIAYGNTATAFADGEFTVAAGTPAALFITGPDNEGIPSGVVFQLAFKKAAGGYTVMAHLDSTNILDKGRVPCAATYAVRRLATTNGASAGMELKA